MIMKSVPPEGGWNRLTFAQYGKVLIRDLLKLSRYVRANRYKATRDAAERVISGQIDRVLARATEKQAKDVEFSLPTTEVFWTTVLNQVFEGNENRQEIVNAMRPHIMSAVSQGYSKVAPAMGVSPTEDVTKVTIPRIGNEIASKITGIDDTTRERLRRIIQQGIDNGETTEEVAKRIREASDSISRIRAQTIARTELTNAYTRGNIIAFQQTPSLTHVSVIGCNGVNDSDHYYQGRHTCNITDVSVDEAHLLTFHPNHTGTMIPSRFSD